MRNLKTGNPMVEVKPIEFPSWEEFQETFNTSHYYNTGNDLHLQNVLVKGKTTITIEISFDNYGVNTEYKYFTFSTEGYKKACGEIERIRLGFIIELCKG